MSKDKGVVLKKGKEVIFDHKHLWIFSGAIESFPPKFENGKISPVYNYLGILLGHAYFNKNKSLCGRVISFFDAEPMQTIYSRIDLALQLRDAFFDLSVTNAFRLVNGEGDLLPGLVIDQYGDFLVIQSGTLGIDLIKKEIVDYLISKNRWKGIFEKSSGASRKEENLAESIGILWGEPLETIPIIENKLNFQVHWRKGQKTGFFLDQREMRKKVQELSFGKKVLNCFSYSGGFSVYALAGGAKSVHSVDISSQAIEWVKGNVEANSSSSKDSQTTVMDAFKFLSQDSLDYDLVILDPPAFAKKKQEIVQASKGYREINYWALSKMPSKSLLLTCSCSYYMEESAFQTILFQAAKMAKREVQIIGKHILGIDHPINLFHPESSYLKSFLLYVV